MAKSICIINGHPDPSPERLVRALCDAYEDGARESGLAVQRINVGELAFPLLEDAASFESEPEEPILSARDKIQAADHIVLAFPLWLGGVPAKTRGFFEQVARAGFFLQTQEGNAQWPRKMMKGKSVRILVTMGMPGLIYETFMDGAVLKQLERGVFGISGFKPVRHTIFGGAGGDKPETYAKWLSKVRKLGAKAG